MVLDTMKKDEDGLTKFFFKNTYEEKKQVKIAMDEKDAPDEFFFVHIKLAPGAPASIKTRSSVASMLQKSCTVFIRQCHGQGLINDDKKECLEKYIMKDSVYRDIHEHMKTFVSKPSYKDGDCQSAHLREIITRVRLNCS